METADGLRTLFKERAVSTKKKFFQPVRPPFPGQTEEKLHLVSGTFALAESRLKLNEGGKFFLYALVSVSPLWGIRIASKKRYVGKVWPFSETNYGKSAPASH